MDSTEIAAFVAELEERYPGATVANDQGRTLVKLPKVWFPPGCKPEYTEGLVLVSPGQPRPELYLRVIPTLPSGGQVTSNAVQVAGESYLTYSFNLNWEEKRNTATQFIEGKLRRFARNG